MKGRVFFDTNVLIYAFISANEIEKTATCKSLLTLNPLISPQVIFEFINVARRKFKYTFEEYSVLLECIFSVCDIVSEDKLIVEKALALLHNFSLQPFDSKIIATALHHHCDILYSEDMQDGLIIENKLKIVNPFLNK